MKETQWDDSIDDSKEFFDTAAILPIDEADDDADEDEAVQTASSKTQLTDLRRRIEERLDGKRIDHEFEYECLDGLLDNIN